MQALSLHCPIHGIIMSWPDYGLREEHPLFCWHLLVYDGTRCALPLALQTWPDPLTPDAPVGMVES